MLEKAIVVRVLLVSADIQTIDTLCRFMEQMAMHVEVCSDSDAATRKLCHAKFEAVVVDCKEGPKALEFLRKSREMTSHKGIVALAILSDSSQMPGAFRAGASFAIVRPLPPAILARTLRASYPFMVREMRRYYRCPLEVPVRVWTSNRPELVANSVNICERGIALACPVPLEVGERVTLSLKLPGTEIAAELEGEVCWANEAGRVGLEFVEVPEKVSTGLQSWLSDRLEERLPC